MIGEPNYPAQEAKGVLTGSRRPDVTVRQNLEEKIVIAEKHLADLKECVSRLDKSGILDSRISDIQEAMRW